MKILFFLFLLIPSLSFAHDEESDCGLCRCHFEERLPEFIRLHDIWWSCRNALEDQQKEYTRCLGAIRECERRLTKKQRKKYINYIENPTVATYDLGQHPIENAANNIPVCQSHVEACETQLGSQIIPEVLACSAHYQWCTNVK